MKTKKIKITAFIFLISSANIYYTTTMLDLHMILCVLSTIVYMILFLFMLLTYEFQDMNIRILPKKKELEFSILTAEEESLKHSPILANIVDEKEEYIVNPTKDYATRKPLT